MTSRLRAECEAFGDTFERTVRSALPPPLRRRLPTVEHRISGDPRLTLGLPLAASALMIATQWIGDPGHVGACTSYAIWAVYFAYVLSLSRGTTAECRTYVLRALACAALALYFFAHAIQRATHITVHVRALSLAASLLFFAPLSWLPRPLCDPLVFAAVSLVTAIVLASTVLDKESGGPAREPVSTIIHVLTLLWSAVVVHYNAPPSLRRRASE